jgi:hypothetical protein
MSGTFSVNSSLNDKSLSDRSRIEYASLSLATNCSSDDWNGERLDDPNPRLCPTLVNLWKSLFMLEVSFGGSSARAKVLTRHNSLFVVLWREWRMNLSKLVYGNRCLDLSLPAETIFGNVCMYGYRFLYERRMLYGSKQRVKLNAMPKSKH